MKRLSLIILAIFCLSVASYAAQKLIIGVHTDGTYSANGTVISLPKLTTLVHRRFRQNGEFPVVLKSDQAVAFSNAWAVVEIAARAGIWRQGVVVDDEEIMFSVPARDRSKSSLSPVMLKGFTGNTVNRGINVYISRDMVTLDGHKVSPSDLRKQFAKIGAASDSIAILIVVSDIAQMDQVGNILKILADTGNKKVNLAREEEIAQPAA